MCNGYPSGHDCMFTLCGVALNVVAAFKKALHIHAWGMRANAGATAVHKERCQRQGLCPIIGTMYDEAAAEGHVPVPASSRCKPFDLGHITMPVNTHMFD